MRSGGRETAGGGQETAGGGLKASGGGRGTTGGGRETVHGGLKAGGHPEDCGPSELRRDGGLLWPVQCVRLGQCQCLDVDQCARGGGETLRTRRPVMQRPSDSWSRCLLRWTLVCCSVALSNGEWSTAKTTVLLLSELAVLVPVTDETSNKRPRRSLLHTSVVIRLSSQPGMKRSSIGV